MNLTVEIPDDPAGRLSAARGDLSRRALEAFGVGEYKRQLLTKSELQRILGMKTSSQLNAFLKATDIPTGRPQAAAKDDDGSVPAFDAEKAQKAGDRIRELRSGVKLDLRGVSIRELAHLGHKY